MLAVEPSPENVAGCSAQKMSAVRTFVAPLVPHTIGCKRLIIYFLELLQKIGLKIGCNVGNFRKKSIVMVTVEAV